MRRKRLESLDPEKEMQGNANVARVFWAAWSALAAGAARFCKEAPPHRPKLQ